MDTKKKILIVEDNPSQQMVLYDRIAKAGFLVRKASSGEEGFQMAMSSQPDLIIVDKMMPNTDGLAMINRLRAQSDWARNVPVLFFSNVGLANEEEKALYAEIKAAGYLSKSENSLDDILLKIRSVLTDAGAVNKDNAPAAQS